MLCALAIRGLAVIEHLDLELQSGLNVFSGETGAGKSILIDAIGLALGNRAARNLIRQDAENAEITLQFDLSTQPAVCSWLNERGFTTDDTLLLRRTLTRSGSSRAYINDTPATTTALREIGAQLIEIHGQHEHQRLLQRDQQRVILDAACSHEKALEDLADCYQRWNDAQTRWNELSRNAEQHQQALALLSFQVEELNALQLEENTYAELDAAQRVLAGAEELRELCASLAQELYEQDEGSIYSRLAAAAEQLQRAAQIDQRLLDAQEFLPQALTQVEETTSLLHETLDRVDLDPQRLAETEQRLGTLHELARKHQVSPQELWQHSQRLNEQLQQWQSPAYDAQALGEEVATLEQDYQAQALSISQTRTQTAERIAKTATDLLHKLGMPHSRFEIAVQHDPERSFGPSGLDDIEYRLATGPDQTPGPLGSLASGGELSRVSLALQQSLSHGSELPVMIFDEVDAGIGGGPAEIVGRLLAQLGQRLQVLCVTHLPQVAVQGHHHYCVRKHGAVRTTIEPLDQEGRVEEIARMFSGIEKTDSARQHAETLLQREQDRTLGLEYSA